VIENGNIFGGKWIMDIPPQSKVKVFAYTSLSEEPEYKVYPNSDDDETNGGERGYGGGGGYLLDIFHEDCCTNESVLCIPYTPTMV
jgi:hypothetical protein